MNYRLGNSRKIHDKGMTVEIECPNCKNKVQFGIFTNLDTRIVAKPSLFDVNNIIFLICPSCATIYTIDESLAQKHKKKDLLKIGVDDLKELKEYNKNE